MRTYVSRENNNFVLYLYISTRHRLPASYLRDKMIETKNDTYVIDYQRAENVIDFGLAISVLI